MTSALPEDQVSRDRIGRLHLAQPRLGYRFSIDSILLAAFAGSPRGPLVDLGAGCGVLPVVLSALGSAGPFTALEIDPLAAACCTANFATAGLDGRVLVHDLAHDHPDLAKGSLAGVISNPPFGRQGHGRIPPEASRARARHELGLEADRVWELAAGLLMNGGRLWVCWPPFRLAAGLAGMAARGLAPKRLRLVHGRIDKPARLALIEAVKGGGEQLDVEPPLIVYGQGQDYTTEVAAIYHALD